jgi:hypothetical protein
VCSLKLVDNKPDHHLRSEPRLKSHFWPCSNGKTRKMSIFFQVFQFGPGHMTNLRPGLDFKGWSSLISTSFNPDTRGKIHWSQDFYKISQFSRFFRSGMAICEILGQIWILNDSETFYLPVRAQKQANKYGGKNFEPRFLRKCYIFQFFSSGRGQKWFWSKIMVTVIIYQIQLRNVANMSFSCIFW